MTPKEMPLCSPAEAPQSNLDFSDLLGVNQVFPAIPDAARQAAMIDAHCNKIGDESCA